MADLGLAGGIGEGLMKFADTYQKQKQLQVQNDLNQQYVDMAKQRENAGLLQSGMVAGPSGSVSYNPEQQQIHDTEQTVGLKTSQQKLAQFDPKSMPSQIKRPLYKQLLNEAAPGLGDQYITDDMSASDLAAVDSHINNILSSKSAVDRASIMARAGIDKATANNDARIRALEEANTTKKIIEGMRGATAEKIQGIKGTQAKEQLGIKGDNAYDVQDLKNDGNAGKEKSKNDAKFVQAWNSFRGNKAAGNANEALRAIGNAKELINQYPNLNAMPQAQANLLAAEIAKVAAGGVATEGGRQEVQSHSFNSKWQEFMGRVGNKPQPAELGAFIKQNVNYLDGLQNVNKKIVDQFHGDVWLGNKRGISDELKQEFQNRYPELNEVDNPKPVQQAAPVKKSGGLVRQGSAKKAPPVGTVKNGYVFKGGDPANQKNWQEQGFLDKAKGLLGF